MSGLIGIVNLDGAPVNRELLEKLTRFMAFRGPHGQDFWADGNIGLGHSRLQTALEPELGIQRHTLGDGIWIAADARIDGGADLANRLGDNGDGNLTRRADVELILRAYRRWGEDCLRYLLGDFAFAIWDGPQRRLFCARDHFGVKPFYYAMTGNALVFSNTLDCIRQHPRVSNRLNELALADFLLFGHNPESSTTTFSDIKRLPPAHKLSWSGAGLKIERYWSLRITEEIRYRQPGDYVERFKEVLTDAVSDRLRVEHAALYMSGGLDSPTLAAAACGHAGSHVTPVKLKAYCLVYDQMPDEERRYSTLVAQALGIPIEHTPVDHYSMFERWDQPDLRRPEPVDWPLLAMNQDSLRAIAMHSAVLLYGEDPDALLAPASLMNQLRSTSPWRIFKDMALHLQRQRRLPPLGLHLRAQFNRLIGRSARRLPFPPWLNPQFASRWDLTHRWENRAKYAAPPSGVIRPEAHQRITSPLWQRLFELNDPGATHVAVEYRYPFLDLRLIEFLLALPSLPWCVNKYIMRVAMGGILPASICERPKTALQFDPYREPLQRADAAWIDDFSAVHRLNEYVIREKIPPVTGANYDANDSWLHLRPLTLNEWFKTARV